MTEEKRRMNTRSLHTQSQSWAEADQEPRVEPRSLSLMTGHTAASPHRRERPLPPSSTAATSPAWAHPHPSRHRRLIVPALLCTWQAFTVTSGNETLPGTHPPERPSRLCAQGSGRSGVEEETAWDPSRHHPAPDSHAAQW